MDDGAEYDDRLLDEPDPTSTEETDVPKDNGTGTSQQLFV